jgi:hypothetical protein
MVSGQVEDSNFKYSIRVNYWRGFPGRIVKRFGHRHRRCLLYPERIFPTVCIMYSVFLYTQCTFSNVRESGASRQRDGSLLCALRSSRSSHNVVALSVSIVFPWRPPSRICTRYTYSSGPLLLCMLLLKR